MERGIRNKFNSGSTPSEEKFNCFILGIFEMEGKRRHRYFSRVSIRVTSAQMWLN